MENLNKIIFNNIKYRLPNNFIKFLSYNTKILNDNDNNNNNNINDNDINNNNENYYDNTKYYILKPKGKKCYVWFTYYEKEFLCILIILNDNNILSENNIYYKIDINYNKNLCYNNTLLYCLIIKNKNKNFIIIDTVYNYNKYNYIIKSNNYLNNINSKIILYSYVISDIYNNNYNKFYIPVISNNLDTLYKIINKINYNVYCISIYSNKKYFGNFILNNKISFINSNISATFKIEASIKNDIYLMYILDNKNNLVFYDYLLIDSYKASIFMNKIFRNIKENLNLDLLEESDDEEDFENINPNKYVNLNISKLFECNYNYKFKKWIPIKLSNENITNKIDLINKIKKSNYNNKI